MCCLGSDSGDLWAGCLISPGGAALPFVPWHFLFTADHILFHVSTGLVLQVGSGGLLI